MGRTSDNIQYLSLSFEGDVNPKSNGIAGSSGGGINNNAVKLVMIKK
jgi:hypothetical protein